ncbi:HAMP domain-containing histidine kinase [Alicyclobacillus tolerans]|uniref:sensor histidine kinase n=1 Tax=Alicyclobacillus tolerans TaxID=90970 RepID=UPI001F163338|nr:HAMP domain-containing sensor histidine kinase [Alicyclobacillus tolerans]MCF8565097.1 HAMP domain-containing histidine kinase [Alicyclobacillus tolerans]
MFRRTRLRLVAWNAILVAAILALFAMAIYSDLRARLLSSVDQQTLGQLQPVIQAIRMGRTPPMLIGRPNRPGPGRLSGFGGSDSPLSRLPLGVLIWNAKGQLASPMPNYLSQDDIRKLQLVAQSGKTQTLLLQGHHIRVVIVPVSPGPERQPGQTLNLRPSSPSPSNLSPSSPSDSLSPSNSSQAGAFQGTAASSPVRLMGLRNVDDVAATLLQLRWLTLIGVLIGLLGAVVIGFILAARALVPIRKAWDRQVQFVADASHELRTPISAIQANAEWMLSNPVSLTDRQVHTVHGIFAESKRLSRLLDHLLSLARSDANVTQLSRKRTDVSALTRDVAEQFTPLCEADGIDFVVQVEEGIEADVDPERIRQVLFNLLDNARKFTAHLASPTLGSPQEATPEKMQEATPARSQITLSCNSNRRSVQWVVSDTGIGMNPEEIPRIFDRFYRGDASRSARGTGLGLSIVKWIVEAHGGTIHVRSQHGQGSEFTAIVPIRTHESHHGS